MLINLRNALMAGKRLPYDAEVEFLESTGTQWIDTGFTPTSDTSVEIGYKTADAQLNTVLFGRRVAYNKKSYCIWANANGKIRFDYAFNTTDNKDGPGSIVGNWVDVSKRKERNFVDGIEYTANTTTTFSCNGNAYLFGMNDNGTANWLVSAQVAYCKIWDNGSLVRDFIPVRKGTVGYLYDRVSGKLFGNAGTGDFVLGQDVVPVEYIESHGTEWINSGVIGEPNIIVEAVYSWGANAFGADNCLVGSNNTSANNRFIPITTSSAKRVEIGAGSGWLFASPTILYDKNITYTARSEFISGSLKFTLDGTTVITDGRALTSTHLNMFIFASNENGGRRRLANAKLNMMKIIKDDAPVRSFRPVRVGTGSTWEGAMMDVLTRRIYRNAGSGAFTYGNDLKYPIPAE